MKKKKEKKKRAHAAIEEDANVEESEILLGSEARAPELQARYSAESESPDMAGDTNPQQTSLVAETGRFEQYRERQYRGSGALQMYRLPQGSRVPGPRACVTAQHPPRDREAGFLADHLLRLKRVDFGLKMMLPSG